VNGSFTNTTGLTLASSGRSDQGIDGQQRHFDAFPFVFGDYEITASLANSCQRRPEWLTLVERRAADIRPR
jgi:hypothetical protein